MSATVPGRRNATQAKRLNDYATIVECVKIAARTCEREFARLEAERRARVWYRRLWRWLTQPLGT